MKMNLSLIITLIQGDSVIRSGIALRNNGLKEHLNLNCDMMLANQSVYLLIHLDMYCDRNSTEHVEW